MKTKNYTHRKVQISLDLVNKTKKRTKQSQLLTNMLRTNLHLLNGNDVNCFILF